MVLLVFSNVSKTKAGSMRFLPFSIPFVIIVFDIDYS
jgi:hypothetical protein